MMMPSTPWMIAASTSPVCLVVWFWPSVAMSVMPPISSAFAVSASCMWTKNGNSSAGMEVAMVRSFACACAGPASPARGTATAPAISSFSRRNFMTSSQIRPLPASQRGTATDPARPPLSAGGPPPLHTCAAERTVSSPQVAVNGDAMAGLCARGLRAVKHGRNREKYFSYFAVRHEYRSANKSHSWLRPELADARCAGLSRRTSR